MPHRSCRTLIACQLLLSAWLTAQSPTFVEGSVETLKCSIKKITPMAKDRRRNPGTLLLVEVTNRSAHRAEPNRFRLRIDADEDGTPVPDLDAWRFARGTFGRSGRAVTPGGKLRYSLQIPQRLGPKAKVRVAVTEASFFDGTAIDASAVEVTGLQVEGYMFGNVTPTHMDRTSCRIANPLDRAVDVAFLATCSKPFDGEVLVRTRLEANEVRQWTIDTVDYSTGRDYVGIGATRLRLVDWSVVADDGQARAAQLLRDVFGRWHRWPEANPALAGHFDLEVRIEPHPDARTPRPVEAFSGNGTFRLDQGGRVTVESADLDAKRRVHAVQMIQEAVVDLRRPPVEEFLRQNRLRLALGGASPRIAFHGTGWNWRSANRSDDWIPTMTIGGGGVIVETGIEGSAVAPVRWQTRPLGAGFVATRRAGQQFDRRFEYGEAADLVVPLGFTEVETLTAVTVTTRKLRLRDWRRLDPAAGAPTVDDGPAAQDLRQAWDAGYRYPAEGAKVQGSLRVEVRPDTEALWEGQRRLTGMFEVEGYRGDTYRRARVVLNGRLGQAQRRRLEELVVDRFRIWYNRDFNARRDFASQFAGARIHAVAGRAGVYRIEGGPYREIRVKDGLVSGLVYPSGAVRELGYSKIGEHQVVTRMTLGDEVVAAQYREFKGFMVPVAMHFERVFGREWGPESLRFDSVRVSR